MISLNEILTDPEWIPHRFDGQGDRVLFAKIPFKTRRQLPFLANFEPALESETLWVSGGDMRQVDISPAPLHFIFHTAFCRSTLLVKVLDQPGAAKGFSEPMIFNDLAAVLDNPAAQNMIAPVLKFFARPSENGETAVIKISNHANRLVPSLMHHQTEAKAVLLSLSLTAFLASVAKKGIEGRVWARRLYREISVYAALELGLSDADKMELTDMQVAGLAWLLHQRHFALLLNSLYGERMVTLYSDQFNACKAETLTALSGLFSFDMDEGKAEEIANSPQFSKHAKLGGDYDNIMATQAKNASSPVVDKEIAMVEKWIDQIVAQTGLQIPINKPFF